jgi:hypothetical protein
MKISLPFIVMGIIVMVFGLIFHFQGQSVVGPETSFMYSNPEWITYGIVILIVGGAFTLIGVLSKIFWKG